MVWAGWYTCTVPPGFWQRRLCLNCVCIDQFRDPVVNTPLYLDTPGCEIRAFDPRRRVATAALPAVSRHALGRRTRPEDALGRRRRPPPTGPAYVSSGRSPREAHVSMDTSSDGGTDSLQECDERPRIVRDELPAVTRGSFPSLDYVHCPEPLLHRPRRQAEAVAL
jgi:hypothetical protein